jgi:serine phosphatase RsbU (regulator of sigma subunit)/anti-sigma regulatory factor (Ser/Thr protein kinase)
VTVGPSLTESAFWVMHTSATEESTPNLGQESGGSANPLSQGAPQIYAQVVTGVTEEAPAGLTHLRRLATAFASAASVDDVARAALSAALGLPGVIRAGIAVDNAGGRQLQFISTDPDALTADHARWCLIDSFDDVPLNDAVRTGSDVFVHDLADLDDRYPSIAARQRALGTQSLAAMSLSTETERVGGLLLSFAPEQKFGAEQRWLLGALASQTSQALRAGMVQQRQSATAEQLQRGLLPRSLPDVAGLSLGAHYQPGGTDSDVGGDWYDVIELPDGRTALVVGDVAGRGTEATLLMCEMRAALRAYAALDPSPGVVLDRMDRLVASWPGSEQIVTVAYGVVSADRRTLTFALAGHPPPLLIQTDAPAGLLGDTAGPALGLRAAPWTDTTVDLDPGGVLVFYTNGIDARGHEGSGIAQAAALVDALGSRRRSPRELCARIAQQVGIDPTDDDLALLAVGLARPDLHRATTALPDDLTAPREARRFLRTTLAGWDVEEDVVDAAELCVSELATNATIHAGAATELTAELDRDALTVLVRDSGSRGHVKLPPSETDPMEIAGRGLALVDALASSWAAEHQADGTTVWFEIERSD